MFDVNGTEISLSRGDTGAIRFHANAKRKDTGEDYTFGERDRCVFSIKSGNQIVKQKSYPMTENTFTVIFMNADTDQLIPGGYTWDVRFVINPYFIDDPPEGDWMDYDDLTFPVAKDTKCMHEGTYYIAKQTIATQEEFTPGHWYFADYRIPVDGDQVITPDLPMDLKLLTVVGDI